ncbi:MAG: LysM peptidoglycan-binding domain-containing protein [Alphaproteobacteria bacterium]|nr:LysM peptidoglycan-binding domain-containing protein [Alphaproteobacteria bacterium]
MLEQVSLKNTLFAPTSRYYGIDVMTIAAPTSEGGSRTTAYIARRFLPQPGNFQLIQEHTVVQGDRLDNIAGRYLGDATLFWRLCDANNAMKPEELTEAVGAKIEITMPQGIAGSRL